MSGRGTNAAQESSMQYSKAGALEFPSGKSAKFWLKKDFRSHARREESQESTKGTNGRCQTTCGIQIGTL